MDSSTIHTRLLTVVCGGSSSGAGAALDEEASTPDADADKAADATGDVASEEEEEEEASADGSLLLCCGSVGNTGEEAVSTGKESKGTAEG
jgi:hypothetical protein